MGKALRYILKINRIFSSLTQKVKKEEKMSKMSQEFAEFAEGVIKISRIEKRWEKIAVLFQDQTGKNESWFLIPKSYFKEVKGKGISLDTERFLRWGVFESPSWFKETAPGVPISLITAELANNLQNHLNQFIFENGFENE